MRCAALTGRGQRRHFRRRRPAGGAARQRQRRTESRARVGRPGARHLLRRHRARHRRLGAAGAGAGWRCAAPHAWRWAWFGAGRAWRCWRPRWPLRATRVGSPARAGASERGTRRSHWRPLRLRPGRLPAVRPRLHRLHDLRRHAAARAAAAARRRSSPSTSCSASASMASSWLWAGLLQRHRGGGPLALLNALLALATLLPVLSAQPAGGVRLGRAVRRRLPVGGRVDHGAGAPQPAGRGLAGRHRRLHDRLRRRPDRRAEPGRLGRRRPRRAGARLRRARPRCWRLGALLAGAAAAAATRAR